MIKKYRCSSCKELFEKDLKQDIKRFKFVNGQMVDYFTEKPLEALECPTCSSNKIEELLDGVPSVNFPLTDLDFSISKKRMSDGLYNDMSHKSKEKSKELKEEMNNTNSSNK